MHQSSGRGVLEHLAAILQAKGLKVLDIERESDVDVFRLGIELSRGPEISLEARFSSGNDAGAGIYLARSLALRWPSAERLLKDLRTQRDATRPFELQTADVEHARKIREARQRLYPIAQIWTLGGPLRFESPETALNSPLLSQAADNIREEVIPKFSSYCDIDRLASAVLAPTGETHLQMLPVSIAAVLVAAGRQQEFLDWREASRNLKRSQKINSFEDEYFMSLVTSARRH